MFPCMNVRVQRTRMYNGHQDYVVHDVERLLALLSVCNYNLIIILSYLKSKSLSDLLSKTTQTYKSYKLKSHTPKFQKRGIHHRKKQFTGFLRRTKRAHLAIATPRPAGAAASIEDWRRRLAAEHIPALVSHAIDPLGCGDALLAAATLTRIAGADLTLAAILGAIAASARSPLDRPA